MKALLATLFFSLGEDVLAGVGLANTVYNIVIYQYGLKMGYVSVIDTYGTTVYGSTQKQGLSTIVIKTILQGILLYFIAAGIFLNMSFLFEYMPDIDSGTRTVKVTAVLFMRLTFINGILDLVFCSTKKYFSIQNHGSIVIVSSLLLAVAHLTVSYLCVNHLNLKVYGIAIATISGKLVDILIQVVCFFYKRHELAWEKVSRAIFYKYNWKAMVKLGLYSSLNLAAELMIYESASIVAQFMGTHITAAWIISFQLCCMSFAISFGIVSSAAILTLTGLKHFTRISKIMARQTRNVSLWAFGAYLGNKDPAKVRTWSVVGITNSLVNSCSNALIYFIFIKKIGALFTDNAEVLDMLRNFFGFSV